MVVCLERGANHYTFRVTAVCVYVTVCVSLAAFPAHYCTDPDVIGGMVGAPSIVHCWADLQSVHGFRSYDNITPSSKCQRVLVLALYMPGC